MLKTKITHKQAIRQLQDLLDEAMANNKNDPDCDIYSKDIEALEMAIKSIKGELR
jgi:hypothetical protein